MSKEMRYCELCRAPANAYETFSRNGKVYTLCSDCTEMIQTSSSLAAPINVYEVDNIGMAYYVVHAQTGDKVSDDFYTKSEAEEAARYLNLNNCT